MNIETMQSNIEKRVQIRPKDFIYYSLAKLVSSLMGSYLLYSGIKTIVGMTGSAESKSAFAWVLPVSVTLFVVSFMTVHISASLMRHTGRKIFFLLTVMMGLILMIGLIPFYYSELEVFQRLFSTDSTGIRQVVLAYSSFAVSGFLLGKNEYLAWG